MRQEKRNDPRSLAMLTGAMVIFGTIGIFRRLLPLSSGLIAFFRGLIGSLFLVGWARLRGHSLRHGLSRGRIALLLFTGGLIGLNWILLFEAYHYTTISVATLCYYMEPTIVVVLSCLLLGERMTPRRGVCVLTALVGMVLISGVAERGLPSAGELTGIALGLGAACLYSAVVLLNKRLSGVDAYEKTVLQLSGAALVMLPYLLLTDGFQAEWRPDTVALLLLVGVVHTGISYALYFGSMDGLRTQTVALFSYIDPVTALLLSALLLSERMTPLGWAGAALILLSAAIGERQPQSATVS